MLFDRGKYTKVAEFNPLQWSSSHTYIALSTTFEATNSRRITDGGFPLRGQVSPHPRPSTVLASMKLYVLINAPHCLRGEGDIITLHPMNVEACRRRAMHSGCSFIVIIVVRWRQRLRRRSIIVVLSAGDDSDGDDASSSSSSFVVVVVVGGGGGGVESS